MFNFLTPKPDADLYNTAITHRITTARLRQTPTLLAATLVGTLMLIGCQQQSAPVADNDSNTSEQISAEDNKTVVQSDSAAARIERFQPLYIAQAQRLQRRLQAEYESLQAADATDSENSLSLNSATETSDGDTKMTTSPSATASPTSNTNKSTETRVNKPESSMASGTNSAGAAGTTSDTTINAAPEAAETDAEVNTSTEVGERDLTVLKRISLEPRKPIILNEEQIIERYQQAMEALYQPVATPFSDQDIDTLLNIATLVPQLFEHAEIADRVNAKSPALARLIIQHQVWEQIEAQQVLDMQQMKLDQQQEFDSLMIKFNDTIKGYDEQIAKYEQTLKSFQ
ncbi:hypothetical protein [Psychrobacter sp. LV10R520-6]|uniref:hypothetical protein n=1 Tax=Psychrobacter sp. LV10R520-6 TaxID=1415574 RepID=UPI0024CDE8C1|nr:hypothetical protein [Psychrobacter sp. LV10R520-6]SNT71214.1 hypothetical protein SAMN04488491_2441 [Psychrobacter sp. LV10R520-6]